MKQNELNLLESQIRLKFKDELKSLNLVFGKGNVNSKVMFVGEAPGAKEDELSKPFMGASGKILHQHLANIGLSLNDVYICNLLKFRPENNKNPSILDIKVQGPFLKKQIEIIKPKFIVTLGNYSSKYILSNFQIDNMKSIESISNIHGKAFRIQIGSETIFVIPFFHPAAIIYNRSLQSKFEKDFVFLKTLLDSNKD